MDGACVWYLVTNDGRGWGRPIATAHKVGFNIKGAFEDGKPELISDYKHQNKYFHIFNQLNFSFSIDML